MKTIFVRNPAELCLLIILLLVSSCRRSDRMVENGLESASEKEQKELLMEHNRLMIAEEMSSIEAYVLRRGWKMDTTSTGLKYMRLDSTSGRLARLMDKVAISYTLSLLDGTICYSSDSTGTLQLIIGQSVEPAGLQQGLLQLREGESALLLVPSYLAYGLTGDGNCIPGSSSIVYKVRLDSILERQP